MILDVVVKLILRVEGNYFCRKYSGSAIYCLVRNGIIAL